jgi:rSAM/selenodomain-associated transferase 1
VPRRRRGAAAHAAVAFVVLAKHPAPGRVKTRLATALGAGAACALYEAFVRDLALRLRAARLPVWWAFTPAAAPFARLVRTRRCFPQRGRDLGARIDHAMRVVHARTGGPVVALGADAPHVSLARLGRAARALARGADAVLGPALDGGYYAIGLRTPCAALFEGIPWSTHGVAAATRRRCRRLGLSCIELAADFDVDEPRDLARLARLAGRRPREFPHVRAALEGLSRRAGSLPPVASPSSGCVRR